MHAHLPRHGLHGGFSGVGGAVAALTMTVGRGSTARLMAGLALLESSDRVLDVGCGPGTAVRTAAKTAAYVTGVDPAPVMLRFARALTRRANITYLEGTAEALPLLDGSVTVAWAIASAHHWSDTSAGLAELFRVLTPAGRLLIAERHTKPGARGLAAHGLTELNADGLVQAATEAGFSSARHEAHQAGARSLFVVRATKPA
jgi:SAM-dependent methyltransferase